MPPPATTAIRIIILLNIGRLAFQERIGAAAKVLEPPLLPCPSAPRDIRLDLGRQKGRGGRGCGR
jgi:hypothetical protein